MVVGDVVNWNSNSVTTYQPAGTVEIVILMVFINGSAVSFGIQDGVTWAAQYPPGGSFQMSSSGKMAITNSHYFQIDAFANGGFSGIQIK